MATRSPLSEILPPLIFGTATFNYQYNVDPFALGPTAIVQRAFAEGVRAFDTSPYYGPAEEILGTAFDTETIRQNYSRDQYFLLTKVGRVAADVFDYSPTWVRESVQRSCKRLKADYLDVVYCHDSEHVTPSEVLEAVRELRRIRDENGTVKYVGISGYPVLILCQLAEMILKETGEPVDIVQSYANYTLQNTRLLSEGLKRLADAGVDIVTNASLLGMGLLRSAGPPVGAMGDFHPAPDGLRQACLDASEWAKQKGEKLEVVAVRSAVEDWLLHGAVVGTFGSPLPNSNSTTAVKLPREKRGVSVMGVSKVEELKETMGIWRSVLDGISDVGDSNSADNVPSTIVENHEWSLARRQTIRQLAKDIRGIIGDQWIDYAWPVPDPSFVRRKREQSP